MPKEVTAWECEYCGSLFKDRIKCKLHESSCGMNPNVPPMQYGGVKLLLVPDFVDEMSGDPDERS